MDEFIAHLGRMVGRLESWEEEVRDVVVDEGRGRVVVRVGYWMRVMGDIGEGEGVENDLVWVLEMEGDVDGNVDGKREAFRVSKSVEFVDGVAAGRLRELMMGGKAA